MTFHKKLLKYIKRNLLLSFTFFLSSLYILVIILLISSSRISTDVKNISTDLDEETIISNYQTYRIETLIKNKFLEMNLDQKIGQMFMLSINGTYITDSTKTLIQDKNISGVVIMSNNIASQEQLKNLITEMQSLADIPLLVGTDQEGGAIARIPWDDARYISQPHLGIVNREDFAYEAGADHATALKNVNINMNLAPVLDVSFISGSSMSSRTLGASAEKVNTLGTQIIKAHKDNVIIATVKHYPGIGRTTTDSHYELPSIDISKEQLLSEELLPFKSAIEQDVEAIMTGHALYPQIDPDYPASLSKILLTDILRGELNFEGVIISDDLHMQALSNFPNKAIDAVNAGTDILLIVDSYQNQIDYIDRIKNAVEEGSISDELISDSVERILRLKYENIY